MSLYKFKGALEHSESNCGDLGMIYSIEDGVLCVYESQDRLGTPCSTNHCQALTAVLAL